ncbi:MAG: hypothetical protein NZL95_07220 [Chitinophagales bacterium]|nr:hypothetical protein [Chitinophagales bacterium]MDW8428326.1 hypothetical protein [Chitinophagales bacterium]
MKETYCDETSLVLACVFLLGTATLQAQNPIDQAKHVAGAVASQAGSIGSAMEMLAGDLKPEALVSSFNMDQWLKKASSLSLDDIKGATSLLGKLAKGLDPSVLQQGFNLKDWTSKLKSFNNWAALAGQAESLLKAINPSAFKSGFDVSKATSALSALESLK